MSLNAVCSAELAVKRWLVMQQNISFHMMHTEGAAPLVSVFFQEIFVSKPALQNHWLFIFSDAQILVLILSVSPFFFFSETYPAHK